MVAIEDNWSQSLADFDSINVTVINKNLSKITDHYLKIIEQKSKKSMFVHTCN